MQISFRYFDYVVVFFRHENGDDVGAVRIHDGGKGNAQGQGNHGTFKHAAANASDHAGAEILRNVGCHRDAERYHRLGGQLFDPVLYDYTEPIWFSNFSLFSSWERSRYADSHIS